MNQALATIIEAKDLNDMSIEEVNKVINDMTRHERGCNVKFKLVIEGILNNRNRLLKCSYCEDLFYPQAG